MACSVKTSSMFNSMREHIFFFKCHAKKKQKRNKLIFN